MFFPVYQKTTPRRRNAAMTSRTDRTTKNAFTATTTREKRRHRAASPAIPARIRYTISSKRRVWLSQTAFPNGCLYNIDSSSGDVKVFLKYGGGELNA